MTPYIIGYLVIGALVGTGIYHALRTNDEVDLHDPEQRRRARSLAAMAIPAWLGMLLLALIMMFDPGRYRVWKYLRGW